MANDGLLSYRSAFFAVSLALCASLYVHAGRTVEGAGDEPKGAPGAATGAASSPATSFPSPSSEGDAASCTVQLAACRSESWNVVARAVASDLEAHARPSVQRTADGAAEPPVETGAAEQKRVRCDIAEQQAREHWTKETPNILASIKDIGKPAWVAAERKKSLDKIAGILGINVTERQKFDVGYDVLWEKQGPAIQAALGASPPDIHALIRTVLAIFREEDDLVERVMGSHARDDYRASELRSRTAIMAILATMAKDPFDDALVW